MGHSSIYFPMGSALVTNGDAATAVARTHNAPLAGNKGEREKTQAAFGFFEAHFDTLGWFLDQ